MAVSVPYNFYYFDELKNNKPDFVSTDPAVCYDAGDSHEDGFKPQLSLKNSLWLDQVLIVEILIRKKRYCASDEDEAMF